MVIMALFLVIISLALAPIIIMQISLSFRLFLHGILLGSINHGNCQWALILFLANER